MSESPTDPRRPSLMLVELNEFDPEHLRAASARLGLRNLPRLLELAHSRTTTEDEVEHHGLDPWVQWVGIHSGAPTAVHGVRRLGETREQTRPQLWNALARRGYRWGAWGVMNAPLGERRGCAFFMPDPWSFDETAYPAALDDVLALPRYVSKNYLDVDRGETLRRALRFVRFFLAPRNLPTGLRFVADALRLVVRSRAPVDVHTFTTLIDYLGVLLFVQLRARTKPDFSVIFLNHIAHLQHQFWFRDRHHPHMELGVRVCDAVVGMLLRDRRPGEALVVVNAFRQQNVAGEGFIVYRQRNPQEALRALGVAGGHVEACMTHDAHVIFDDAAAADRAAAVLASCALSDGRKVFYVERRGRAGLFYQIDIDRRVPDGARLVVGDRTIPFDEVFAFVTERTGAHTTEGDVFADGIDLPAEFPNHALFGAVLHHFGAEDEVQERPAVLAAAAGAGSQQ
jgi:hypothetical protein